MKWGYLAHKHRYLFYKPSIDEDAAVNSAPYVYYT
jgi:hypothetical protein